MTALKPDTLYYSPNEIRGKLPLLFTAAESSNYLILDYGWLSGSDIVLVEHKTLDDLAQSLRSRHLDDQLERAKALTPFVYLVVTGFPVGQQGDPTALLCCRSANGVHLTKSEWSYQDFVAAVIAKIHGLQVNGPLYNFDLQATACCIQTLFTQTRRVHLGAGRPVIEKWRNTIRRDQAESYARALRGIGWQRAEALAEFAPTWRELIGKLEGGPAILTCLRLFGPITAKRIYDEVMKGER